MATPDFHNDRGRQEADAQQAKAGAEQITRIKAQMTSFVDDFNARSAGSMVSRTVAANAEIDAALKKLTSQIDDFAHAEGQFAGFADQIDEEA